jgi:hypothetical protein
MRPRRRVDPTAQLAWLPRSPRARNPHETPGDTPRRPRHFARRRIRGRAATREFGERVDLRGSAGSASGPGLGSREATAVRRASGGASLGGARGAGAVAAWSTRGGWGACGAQRVRPGRRVAGGRGRCGAAGATRRCAAAGGARQVGRGRCGRRGAVGAALRRCGLGEAGALRRFFTLPPRLSCQDSRTAQFRG